MTGETFYEFLASRRSIRSFVPHQRIPKDTLRRIVAAGLTAPSSSNRQPWRFVVITEPARIAAVADAVKMAQQRIDQVISLSHHYSDYQGYGDFFWEPLCNASALILPFCRTHPDLIARLIVDGGGDPADFVTPSAMPHEVCATAAAVMTMLLQAHAEDLGAIWMAGPVVATQEIRAMFDIPPILQMLGMMAVGWKEMVPAPTPRKELDQVVTWFGESE